MTAAGHWGGWHDDAAVRQALFHGASQDGWELAGAMAAVAALRPKAVVELGCDRGGGLYAWRQVCGRVYGITLADNSLETGGSGLALQTHGAEVLIGDSHSIASRAWLISRLYPQILRAPELARRLRPVDALILDGDHSAAGIRLDLAMYGPLVRPGGLVLLHDIHSLAQACPPVEAAQVWAELQARYRTSEIHNPSGGFGWGLVHVRPADTFADTPGR